MTTLVLAVAIWAWFRIVPGAVMLPTTVAHDPFGDALRARLGELRSARVDLTVERDAPRLVREVEEFLRGQHDDPGSAS